MSFANSSTNANWADSMEEDPEADAVVTDVTVRGLPHQRPQKSIASMQCEKATVDWEEIQEMLTLAFSSDGGSGGDGRLSCKPSGSSSAVFAGVPPGAPEQIDPNTTTMDRSLPHATDADRWKLSEHLPAERLEIEEFSDPMLDRGMAIGRAGNGIRLHCLQSEV